MNSMHAHPIAERMGFEDIILFGGQRALATFRLHVSFVLEAASPLSPMERLALTGRLAHGYPKRGRKSWSSAQKKPWCLVTNG